MKHSRTTHALLKENKNALQFLHTAYGMDFESPYFIKRLSDRFTHNMVTKAITEEITGDYVAAILIKPNAKYCFDRLHVMTVGASKFENPDRQTQQMWKWDIDNFYGVGQFEEVRKNKTKFVYIIAQKTEYLKKPKQKVFDFDTRYKINTSAWGGGIERSGDGKGNSWINRITLLSPVGAREALTYEPFHNFYPSDRMTCGTDINNYIDKSGYLIREKRHDLKVRAARLKAEREKQAYLKTDYSLRKTTIYNGLYSIQTKIADLALKANTPDAANRLYETALHFKWLMRDVERMKNTEYNSNTSAQRAFEEIEKQIKELLTDENAAEEVQK